MISRSCTVRRSTVVSWPSDKRDRSSSAGAPSPPTSQKLNEQPLTKGGTCFTDEHPLATDAFYEVRGGGHNGSYTLKHTDPDGYVAVKLQKPADGTTPDGQTYTYSANDASVADVDGDGQYEIILKWDPSNAHDNAHDGFTGPTLFDCYKITPQTNTDESRLLWRIDMGINIRSGAHYVPFIFYALDGDGRGAEKFCRTSQQSLWHGEFVGQLVEL